MVSDQEIANGVESLLRQSGPNVFTSVNGVVQQLGAKLGLDLSHKAGFIQNQINLLLRQHAQPPPSKDHIILQHHPQPHQNQPQIPPHFALHHHRPEDLNFRYTPPQTQPQPQPQPQLQPQPQTKSQPQPQPQPQHNPQPQLPHPHPLPQQSASAFVQNVAAAAAVPEVPKESAPTGAKRRGASGGLNKVCGVSPELQTIVGEPAMPRTEIVKQLWAYIRKNNLQDPSNKRKIICDDALRLLFETDCTDMFKMNKLLSKHIIRLEPPKESVQDTKRLKVGTEFASESSETVTSPIIISDALAKFFGTGEREMLQVEAQRRVWEYIKANHLEDPLNSMVIMCDAKLQELLGCESISALGISEMLTHHLFKQS